jgi:hypothetical protein
MIKTNQIYLYKANLATKELILLLEKKMMEIYTCLHILLDMDTITLLLRQLIQRECILHQLQILVRVAQITIRILGQW